MDSYCDFYFNQKSSLGFLAEEEEFCGEIKKSNNFDDDSISCCSDSSSIASDSFMEGEEEVNSSSMSTNCPLQDMSSLLQQLPSKKGLSKHYQGKSQSFTSLSHVLCLEDMVKPENPYDKKLKSCRSYAGGLSGHRRPINQSNQDHRSSPPRIVSKKASWGCYRPPMGPHRSTSTNSISNQTALFA